VRACVLHHTCVRECVRACLRAGQNCTVCTDQTVPIEGVVTSPVVSPAQGM
jgi:hypothetical protein